METPRPSWVIALEHEFFRLLRLREHGTPRGKWIEGRVCSWHQRRRGAEYADRPTYIMCPDPPIARTRRGTFEGTLARPENR
jgi:hypothetical protein